MTQDKELCFLWDNTIHGAIPAFEKFEAAFAFEKVFEHPYCPEEVDLKAYILKPNGDQKQISGFWYEGFQRVLRNGREILISTLEKDWRIRYSAQVSGEGGALFYGNPIGQKGLVAGFRTGSGLSGVFRRQPLFRHWT